MRFLFPVFAHQHMALASARNFQTEVKRLGHECAMAIIKSPFVTRCDLMKAFEDIDFDAVICVNGFRDDWKNAFPTGKPFVTWLQDQTTGVIYKNASEWNDGGRDLIIGYTGIAAKWGFDRRKMINMPILVDPDKFLPMEAGKTCDVAFATQKGLPPLRFLKQHVLPSLKKRGIKLADWALIEKTKDLEKLYRDGGKITRPADLLDFYAKDGLLRTQFKRMTERDRHFVVDLMLFNWVNEPAYRQAYLRLLIGMGAAVDIRGFGWRDNPEFHKISGPAIPYGKELSKFYQRGEFALHLNSLEMNHQRPWEILMSGGRILARDMNAWARKSALFNREKFINVQKEAVGKVISRFV